MTKKLTQKYKILIDKWEIKSANEVSEGGAVISTPSYKPVSWYPTTVPSTVLAALVANGVYTNPYYSKNLISIPDLTNEDWWYRTNFTLPSPTTGQEYWLQLKGINYRADIWLNGTKIADKYEVVGTYRNFEFNITDNVNHGRTNALAIKVYPPSSEELTFTYVDWNPSPPDNNTGIWNKVFIKSSGPVALRYPHVISKPKIPSLDAAALTVTAELTNSSSSLIQGTLKGKIESIQFSQDVSLSPGERKIVTFDPVLYAQLNISNPRVWWPYHMGNPELYKMDISFEVDDKVSDSQTLTFGIRNFTSKKVDGYRQFYINDEKVLIRGGGYTWDMMIRFSKEREETEIKYIKDMGLNAIRLEGKLGNEDLYDLCDREGIMIMAGWCCCSHWEKWSFWNSEDYDVAYASLDSQIRNLRNHPSVFVWLNGSDFPPPSHVLNKYITILESLNWPNPHISNATSNGSTGVKMEGPYEWVPPYYWYNDIRRGGAFGYATEISPGPTVPPLESLRKMIPESHLWPIDSYWDYHAGLSPFNNIDIFKNALNGRYGISGSGAEFCTKSQLAAYEGIRAMFEAYRAHKYTSTGVIQWMLNNSWPSIIWHLYDYYLKPGGGYFGAKKACQPLHVLYDYDTKDVVVVNATLKSFNNTKVSAKVYNIDLTQKYSREVIKDIEANSSVIAFMIPAISGLSTTYFIRLTLKNLFNTLVSSNLYWYSTDPDVCNYGGSTWHYTPTNSYAVLTGLNNLPATDVDVSGTAVINNRDETASITVNNSSGNLAFFIRVEITKGPGGEEVLPVLYEDNYFTLWPGEKRTITATYQTVNLEGQRAYVKISGYNVNEKLTPIQY